MKFKNWLPKTLLNSDGLFSPESDIEVIIIPYISKQVGEYFVEEAMRIEDYEDCTYYTYYFSHLKCLGFKGKLFKKRLKDIKSIKTTNICLTGEVSALNYSQGLVQLNFGERIYIGNLDNYYLNGKGKILFNGYKLSCNFLSGMIDGNFVFKDKFMICKYSIKAGKVLKEFKVKLKENDSNIFIDLKCDKFAADKIMTSVQINNIKKVLANNIKLIYNIQIILVQTLSILKMSTSVDSKSLLNKNFSSVLKNKSTNWLDYEGKVLENSTDLVRMSNEVLIFIGENGNGKGIVMLNNNKYKGQVKDVQLNGCGMLLDGNKISYLGEYENGMRNGIGYCIYSNGYKYQGGWKADKKHGIGYLFTGSSVIYGKWENDYLIEQLSLKITLFKSCN